MSFRPDIEKARQAVDAVASTGSVSAAAKLLGVSRGSVQCRLRTAGKHNVPGANEAVRIVSGNYHRRGKRPPAPTVVARAGGVRRVILTAAQDDTSIHEGFWANLQAYAAHCGAEIMVGGFTYQKGLFEDHAVASGRFDQRISPFLRPEVVPLGPRIVWYGAANILPTASDPLAGWETPTRDKWAVFPHAKIALRCVPTMPGAPGKQVMTTGVVTVQNYVQRNAGQKASFHHTIGATLVEVTPAGAHFCRQIIANRDGSFQDLDAVVKDARVSTGHTIEAVTWGDIHREFLDPEVAAGSWGFDVGTAACTQEGSILDILKPKHQFIHDSFNFTARSHHTRSDPHERARRIAEGRDSVEAEIQATADFLAAVRRPWSTVVHVDSNHNQHLHRWVKDPAGHADAANARYWHEMNAATHRAIELGDTEFLIHEHALRRAAPDGLEGVVFLRAGQSYQVCQATSHVECGLHADIGPNGARGSAPAFARVVERINGAHGHHPIIRESYYQAGTSSSLDMEYNTKGPGMWAHAHIAVYPSGKRTIITMNGKDWRA